MIDAAQSRKDLIEGKKDEIKEKKKNNDSFGEINI